MGISSAAHIPFDVSERSQKFQLKASLYFRAAADGRRQDMIQTILKICRGDDLSWRERSALGYAKMADQQGVDRETRFVETMVDRFGVQVLHEMGGFKGLEGPRSPFGMN
ncbi:MAG: hypothetical protein AB7E85_00285 [Pseudobdellovibrionaceae bacterium]